MERYTGKENQIITSNEKIILFHGSKSGIEGMIAPNSRDKCDFGKGFELALKTGYDWENPESGIVKKWCTGQDMYIATGIIIQAKAAGRFIKLQMKKWWMKAGCDFIRWM